MFISYTRLWIASLFVSQRGEKLRGVLVRGRRSFVIYRNKWSFILISKGYPARWITAFEVICLILSKVSWNWIQSIMLTFHRLSRIVDRKYWAHLYYFSHLTGDSCISLFWSTFELVELERGIWQLNFLGVIQTFSVIKRKCTAHIMWIFLKSGADFYKKTAYIFTAGL